MRTLSSGAAAVFAGPVVPLVVLVEMDLTEALNLNTSDLDLTLVGITYTGAGALGQIDAIQETSAELPQISFTLSGVDPSLIALALAEPIQGKAVRIKMAVFDPTTGALVDVRLRYAGILDVMSIVDGRETAAIKATSESVALDLLKAKGLYYSDSDQQALHPGDLSMQYLNDQVEQKLVWPSAAFFRK